MSSNTGNEHDEEAERLIIDPLRQSLLQRNAARPTAEQWDVEATIENIKRLAKG